MTPHDLTQKLMGLRQQLLQLHANANAVAGAIQFGEQLLAELSPDPDPPTAPSEVT